VWLVDLLQTAQWQYYVFINVNSRYLVVIPANAFVLNSKIYVDSDVDAQGIRCGTSYLQFAQALESFLSRGFNVTILKGDSQQSFNPFGTITGRPTQAALPVAQWYMRYNIKFHPIERLKYNNPDAKKQDDPYHTSIAILDRVCRTLRDMHDK
jgi:hypothetical protein